MQNEPRTADIQNPEFLLTAYGNGFFPMAEPGTGEIAWYSPDPRTIIELNGLRVSRSLRRSLRQGSLVVQWNTAFDRVIRACGDRSDTWISEKIIAAYAELFRLGFAHCVEVWKGDSLVGGLYGVSIGGVFFGESMFSRTADASKIALVHLVHRMKEQGFLLLDAQFMSDHLRSLGAVEIPKKEYLRRLRAAVEKPCSLTVLTSRAGE
jgi:leucyl/phenylalanyl-tRNA--protein transferase